MRLDKYLSNANIASRKDVKKLIKQQRVEVNGVCAKKPDMNVEYSDKIFVDGDPIELKEHLYLLFYKPAGYICANYDKLHKTIFDILDHPQKDELQICGRLDMDVTGLVVLTNDGQFNHLLTTPKKGHYKEYIVTFEGSTMGLETEYPNGIILENDNEYHTRPFHIEVKNADTLHIFVTEGRYHLVKNIISELGLKLTHLHRVKVGPYHLPNDMVEGELREVEKMV